MLSAVLANEPITQFVVLGDWGGEVLPEHRDFDFAGDWRQWKTTTAFQISKLFEEQQASEVNCKQDFFVVTTGDNFYPNGVQSVNDKKWQTEFIQPFEAVRCPWYPVLGNHDWQGDAYAQTQYTGDEHWKMNDFYYTETFNNNNVEFFFLDTQLLCPKYSLRHVARTKLTTRLTEENRIKQLDWLEKALLKSTAKWRFVVGHYPVYSGGVYKNNPEMKAVETLLKQYKVDAYFCGHDHNLQHIHNSELTELHHFLSGSAGGAHGKLYRVRGIHNYTVWNASLTGFMNCFVHGSVMNVQFIDWKGRIAYETTITARTDRGDRGGDDGDLNGELKGIVDSGNNVDGGDLVDDGGSGDDQHNDHREL